MRATVHNDGRGARLGTDDMAGGRALYGPVGGGGTPKAPTKLTRAARDRRRDAAVERSLRRRTGFPRLSPARRRELRGGRPDRRRSDLVRRPESRQRHLDLRGARVQRRPRRASRAIASAWWCRSVRRASLALAETAFYGSEESGQAVLTLERVGGSSGPLSVRLRTQRSLRRRAARLRRARRGRHLGPSGRPAQGGHALDRRRLHRRGERADRGPARDGAGRGPEPGLPARHRRRRHRRRRRLARLCRRRPPPLPPRRQVQGRSRMARPTHRRSRLRPRAGRQRPERLLLVLPDGERRADRQGARRTSAHRRALALLRRAVRRRVLGDGDRHRHRLGQALPQRAGRHLRRRRHHGVPAGRPGDHGHERPRRELARARRSRARRRSRHSLRARRAFPVRSRCASSAVASRSTSPGATTAPAGPVSAARFHSAT